LLAPGDVAVTSPAAFVSFGAGTGVAFGGTLAPAVTSEGDDCNGAPTMRVWSVDAAGVPTALSTPPAERNEDPTTNVMTRTATAAALTALELRGNRRRWFAVRLSGCTTGRGDCLTTLTPHPGHAPEAVAQHRSHAKTQQDAHIRSPTRRSVEAAPIRFPQRSQ